MKRISRVVTIGGGTGSYTSLTGLKKHPLKLTAIVNMIDDGGSSGRLRDELGVLPPGDVRQCLVALSGSSRLLRQMFNFRFENGDLKGHNFGNLFLSALEKQTGSMKKAISEIGKILNIKGQVVPVTFTKRAKLCVDLRDGKTIKGETHIDEVEKKENRAPIEKVYLNPKASLNPDAKKAIMEADFILIGPGDLYTSVIPNILVTNMAETIKKSKAKKIFTVNLMTKYGHTSGYGAKKHLSELEKYLGRDVVDYVLVNSKKPKKIAHSWYEEFEEYPVEDDFSERDDFEIVRKNLIKDLLITQNPADSRRRSIIRHDSKKLASAVMGIINSANS